MNSAVFLDRDGVLIEDVHLLTKPEQIRIPSGVAAALTKLKAAGYKLIVVSNQTVVSRGLATEAQVGTVNRRMEELLNTQGAPRFDGFYICPHHPKATLEEYRSECECRKPRPGLILKAGREHNVDLARSFMIGDRITDIVAGAKAGCRTILVQTGQHTAAPIESVEPLDKNITPDHTCADLNAAANWILAIK